MVSMSMSSSREYLDTIRQRYKNAATRAEKSHLIDEVVDVLGSHRKYAIQAPNCPKPAVKKTVKRGSAQSSTEKRCRQSSLAWEALDFPCAERLHPVLASTAEVLASHGELSLTTEMRRQLSRIGRATLARRLKRLCSPKARSLPERAPNTDLRAEIPVERYGWEEARPCALDVDLVEHNGGLSLGIFA